MQHDMDELRAGIRLFALCQPLDVAAPPAADGLDYRNE
jgi:hypothetical protein